MPAMNAALRTEMREALKEMFLAVGEKNDPTGLAAGPYGHGSGGLFSQAGQDPMVFSAMNVPMPGLMAELPVIWDDDDTNSAPDFGGVQAEFMTILTGVTKGALETWANQPTTQCADGARAGLMKVCTLINLAGNMRFSPSNPINIVNAGKRRDIADPLTLRLMNNPAVQQTFGVPTTARSAQNALMNEFARRNFEMGTSISRLMGQLVYSGTPANNNGEARQFVGLDTWINTGNKRDATTMNVCTAANSNIMDFNYSLLNLNSKDIQNYAETMIGWLDWNTSRQGLGERWEGVIAMRPGQWDEITKVITVRQYQEVMAQANLFTNTRTVIDARDELKFRNDLRSMKQWPLRGRMIPVVLDDSIVENSVTTTGNLVAGQYAADIYFVPMTVLGGTPVTYWKPFNHMNENSMTLERLPGSATFTSDGGMFRWYINSRNGCIDWTVQILPKLVMRTPQLAGRIQNVGYQPLLHFTDSNPDSSYFANGGRTSGSTSTFYSMWGSTTPAVIS